MARQRVKLTFPPELITEPVIYNLGNEFEVVTNIRRAKVTRDPKRTWDVSGGGGAISAVSLRSFQ